MDILITILGEPLGKARARIGKWGSYTPEKTVNYEVQIKERFATEYPDLIPTDKPVMMSINAYYSIPKSTSNKRKQLMIEEEIYPLKKPDVDNIGKIVMDGLNKIAYQDDSQVISLSVAKWYSEVPRCEITLKVLD